MRIIYTIVFLLLFSAPGFAFQSGIEALDTLLKVNESIQEEVEEKKPSLEGSIRKAQEFTIQLNRMNFILSRELDTLLLMAEMPQAERLVLVVQNRIEDRSNKINIRYLNELENLLRNIRSQVADAERRVINRTEQLIEIRSQVEEMKSADLMRLDVRDPSILPEYQTALSQLRERISQTDSTLNAQRVLTAGFQTKISRMMIKLSELSSAIEIERRNAERALLTKDINYIWEKKSYEPNIQLSAVFIESIRLNEVILTRYLKNHIGISFFVLIVFILLVFWINKVLNKIRDGKEFAKIILDRAHYVPQYPMLSVLLIILPFIPFLYSNPTISFLTLLLWLAVLSVSVLLKSNFPNRLFLVWLGFVFTVFIYTISNLYRDVNFSERWYLLGLSFVGVFLAVQIVRFRKNNSELLPTLIDTLVKLYIGMQVFSIFANVFGRFSLSKLLGVAATMSFAQAIGLYLFVQIVMEVIYLQLEVSRKSENDFTSYIDFHGIQQRTKKILYGVASLIWIYYFLDNLSLLDLFFDEGKLFLTKERSLISTNFTFGNILVFFLIVYISSLLANNLAYFATIKDQQKATLRDKRLGSSILLIRLGVLSLGFILAIGASGIGFEKIAIVLGALTLGISFGLQTIVNNLVSGVILAFEKPIQIGDSIEVGGRSGIVKDVGIRSSKIQSYDGSEIIIPNGDLLSQHLINWTLSDKKRRVELIIGVSYGADVDLVTDLIMRQLDIDEIMKVPEPRVYLQTFADSAIEFRVLFWVENFDMWVVIRNQVMRGIFKAFKENGIEIPFPQRDLNFKNFPAILDEKVKSEEEIKDLEKLKKIKGEDSEEEKKQ